MADLMPREDWLLQELDHERAAISRLEASDDPFDIAMRTRAELRLVDFEHQLSLLRGDPTLALRLSGGRIQGHAAPLETIKVMYDQMVVLADDYEAEVLVPPSEPGSHVLRFEPATQGQLDLEPSVPGGDRVQPHETFVVLAQTIIGFSPQVTAGINESITADRAADMSPAAVIAVRKMMETLARSNLNIEFTLHAHMQRTRARISSSEATNLDLWLGQVDRKTEVEEVHGRLDGWTQGSGTFEIYVAGEIVSGRVPKKARLEGVGLGLAIGQEVVATVEVTTSVRPSGTRLNRKLMKIRSA